jgi:hypothetical protein
LKVASVDLEQDVEKWMDPSSGAESLWPWCSSAPTTEAIKKNAGHKTHIRRIEPPKNELSRQKNSS